MCVTYYSVQSALTYSLNLVIRGTPLSEEVKEKSGINYIYLLVPIIGIVISLEGYIVGLAYYNGYLNAYGVSPNSFTFTTQELYVFAYFYFTLVWVDIISFFADLFSIIFSATGFYWVIGILSSVLSICHFFKKINWKPEISHIANWIDKLKIFLCLASATNRQVALNTGIATISFYMIFYVLILIMALWVFMPHYAYKKGELIANEAIEAYLSEGCSVKDNERWGKCKALKDKSGQIIYSGLLIGEADGVVAFLTKDGSFVTKMPDGAVIENKLFKKN